MIELEFYPPDVRRIPVQPLLHNDVVALSAPTQVWSATNGEIGSRPIHGVYHSDTRVISRVTLRVGGEQPEPISNSRKDATSGRFVSVLRDLDDLSADPKVRLDRIRRVESGRMTETLTFTTALEEPITTDVEIELVPEFSVMHSIKAGTSDELPVHELGTASWSHGSLTATAHALEATISDTPEGAVISWLITVPSRGTLTLTWSIDITDDRSVVTGASPSSYWDTFEVVSGDSRLAHWLHRAMDDLKALRMTASPAPSEPFLAAGAPWFFTLFGRDSIWSARFMLPLGTELAASTLRVLAQLQGKREVAETAEQPGKIMHELRAGTQTIPAEGVTLPPLYYGTIDATPLWAVLLHEAWRWGMADSEVAELLPNLEAALAWMRDYGDSDGDGFLEYVDTTGHGLANQGWKDSGDSIQWSNGELAKGSIALCEVQAYAYQAAVGGAEILAHFGRDAAAENWRQWAAVLKERFAESFWIDSEAGAYPAIALDAHKNRVDSVASNMGHLLGTGLLDEEQSRLVANRLVSPQLSSGYGLRTLSTDAAGFWPLSYHGGTVWTHDTAIAIAGLGRAGFGDEALVLIDGLLASAAGFHYRSPELHSGDSAQDVSSPVPYPAACRPQAWSAAAAVVVLQTLLGLEPPSSDGAALEIAPLSHGSRISVDGLRFQGRLFSLSTDGEGKVKRNTLHDPSR